MPPSIRQLCKRAKISFKTSRMTIQFINNGMISFPKRGHGVGSIKQLTDEEEDFLIELQKHQMCWMTSLWVMLEACIGIMDTNRFHILTT